MLIQIAALVFSLFAISRAILRTRDKKLKNTELFFWSVVWISVIVFVIFPGALGDLANIVGIGRGVDFLIYISLLVMFYMIFRLYVKLEERDQEITLLVREIAYMKKEKK